MKASFVVFGALLFASNANAQNVDGSFRLALEGTPLAYDHVTLSMGSSSVTASNATVGLPGPALGVALGYGATSNVLVGARLLTSSTQSKLSDASADTKGFALFPQVEYLFPGTVVRPFVSANIGYRATGASGAADSSTSTFLIGPGVGVHGFVSAGLSLDAGVTGLFQKGTTKSNAAEFDSSGYSLLLTLGISGWLGGSSTTAAAASLPPPLDQAGPPETSTSAGADDGLIESAFALDLPNTAGGMQVTIHGHPDKDPEHAQIIVSFLKSPEMGADCHSVAFETGETRTELADLRSSSRGGFGSALTTQAGSVQLAALGLVADANQETWLSICDERVVVLPAAKHRVERFLGAFRNRASSAR